MTTTRNVDFSSSIALYHAIWLRVKDTFIDVARLVDWNSWEHRFDESIDSDETALQCADAMLASLGDPYTERVISQAPVASHEMTAETVSSDSAQQVVQSVLRPDGIAYLRISSFDRGDIADLVQASLSKIADCKAIVLDLRHNGGGRIDQVLKCLCYFVKNGLLTTVELRHEDGIKSIQYFVNEGQFYARETSPDGSQTTELYERRQPVFAGKPLVLNMDSRTASGGEMMIASLAQNAEDGQVRIVGRGKTPGKGIGQLENDILDGRACVQITRSRWLAPGGEWIGDCGQTKSDGLEPDIVVSEGHVTACFEASLKAINEMLETRELACV
jgi:C-terminal processing protease CtpA/Prc